jgi:hypothetical protein
MYKIKLRKCAYIFDNSATTFKLGRQQAEQDHKKQTILKEYYDSAEKRSEWIPATKKTIKFYNGETAEQTQIVLNNITFNLNALQIAETNNAGEIYNHKKVIDLKGFTSPHFRGTCAHRVYSNKYKTLEVETFTSAEDLGYIRIHFKGNCIIFVIDTKNNLYTAEGIEHRPTTRAQLSKALDITSSGAFKEFEEVMNYLQDRSNQAGGVKND